MPSEASNPSQPLPNADNNKSPRDKPANDVLTVEEAAGMPENQFIKTTDDELGADTPDRTHDDEVRDKFWSGHAAQGGHTTDNGGH